MSDTVRAAVIGVGYLGRFHAQKYSAIESSELIGVCDLDEVKGQAIADELKTGYFKNYKDLIGQVDAVTIAATTTAHFELSKFFLENGVHVLVEKPMTETSEQGQVLCELARKNNLKLQVGHNERFNPALVSAREKLKKPLFIECHRLAPFKPRGVDVNVVLDLMIHDLDVILSMVQSAPVSVHAVGTPVLTKTTDIANARIEFESGAVANVTASRVSQKTARKFRVFQSTQYLSVDFGTGEVNFLTKTGDWKEDEIPIDAEAWNLEKGDALLEETKAFLHSILSGERPIVSGEDGLVALKLAEDIIEHIDQRVEKFQSKGQI